MLIYVALVVVLPLATLGIEHVFFAAHEANARSSRNAFEFGSKPGDVHSTSNHSDSRGSLWVPAITAIIGLAVGVASTQFQSYIAARNAQMQEWQRVRSKYLNPLRFAVRDSIHWIELYLDEKLVPPPGHPKRNDPCDLDSKRRNTDELRNWFCWVKNIAEGKDSKSGFFDHCNGQLYFAVSTLYVSAKLFAAMRIFKQNAPYIKTAEFTDRDVLEQIRELTDAFGGLYGVWSQLQESIGDELIKANGELLTYREFCASLINDEDYSWYLRLMDVWIAIGENYEQLERAQNGLRKMEVYLTPITDHRIRFFGRDWIFDGIPEREPRKSS